MRILTNGLALLAICALSISPLSARPVRIPRPDELAAKATLICNGRVESIIKGRTVPGTGGVWDSITYFTAKIRILHVFKGQAPPEVEIKYHLGPNVPNGPIQMDLKEGGRYRFFLRNGTSDSSFVGALEGQYDDGFAAKALGPQEPDDSSY